MSDLPRLADPIEARPPERRSILERVLGVVTEVRASEGVTALLLTLNVFLLLTAYYVIKPVREGIELTLKLFHDTLKRYQLDVIDPHGAPFNAEHHQAMAMQESTHVEPNSVLKVFQKGYMLNGRLLRPAMVVVSKAPAEPSPSIDEQA